MFLRGRPALFLLAALIAGVALGHSAHAQTAQSQTAQSQTAQGQTAQGQTAQGQTASGRPGSGQAGDGPVSCIAPPPDCVLYNDPNHKRCGSRGGPGCRKADGHCASWNDKVARDCRIPARAPKSAKPVAPSE